jgi:hypothetical protein
MEPQSFLPIHSALIGRAELASLAALLGAHPDHEAADVALKLLADRAGAGSDAGAVAAYQKGADALARDGEIEIDEDAVVSIGDDSGAYVQAWLWVSDEAAGLSQQEASDPDEKK